MSELLVIPAWNASPRTLEDWAEALAAQGHYTVVARENDEVWLEVAPLRLRGFVELEGRNVEAINFEFPDADTEPASRAVVAAATQLGWEVHPDEPEEDSVDED